MHASKWCLALQALLFASTANTADAAWVSSEIGNDRPVWGPASQYSETMAVASDGSRTLAVWSDRRSGDHDVYGAFVDAVGAVSTAPSLLIAGGIGDQYLPAVTFDGTNFVVAWTSIGASSHELRAARVTPAGTILDPSGFRVATTSPGMLVSALTSNGSGRSLIAWLHKPALSSSPSSLMAARISATGIVIDSAGLSLGANPNVYVQPSASFDGENYIVAWFDTPSSTARIAVRRIRTDGTFVDTVPITVASADPALAINPAVGCGTTVCLVAWGGPSSSIVAKRLNRSGGLLDSSEIVIARNATNPWITFGGGQFAVAWQGEYQTVMATTVSEAGAVSPTRVGFGSSLSRPCITAGPGGGFIAAAPGSETVHRITSSFVLVDVEGVAVARAANAQRAPAAATNGREFLTVWIDERGGVPSVLGTRYGSDGTARDASPIVIHAGTGQGDSEPAVAFDGAQFVVVYADEVRAIRATRVSASGQVLDPSGVMITDSSNGDPAVTSDGLQAWIVWSRLVSTAQEDILLARFSRAGALIDSSPIGVFTAGGRQRLPSACFDGQQVWIAGTDEFGTGLARRLSPSGVGAAPIGFGLNGNPAATGRLGLASGPTCLAYWGSKVARLSRGGDVLDPEGIELDGVPGTRALSAVWDGAKWFAISGVEDGRVLGARVSTSGTLIDPTPLLLFRGQRGLRRLALTSSRGGRSWIAYQRFDETPAVIADRVFARTLEDLVPGEPCRTHAACAGDHCIDGVCCTTACDDGELLNCEACSIAMGATVDGVCGSTTGNGCDDGDACTRTDACRSGTCVGADDVLCPAPGECGVEGQCAPATGACSAPTARPDGDRCLGGECLRGMCVAAPDAGATVPDAESHDVGDVGPSLLDAGVRGDSRPPSPTAGVRPRDGCSCEATESSVDPLWSLGFIVLTFGWRCRSSPSSAGRKASAPRG